MKDTIVYYFSRTHNNEYLAKRIAKEISCDVEELKSRNPVFFLNIIAGLFPFGFGVKKLNNNPSSYKNVILCAPLWTGKIASPARDFLRKHSKVHFVTCCGSSDEKKNDTFGYEKIFSQYRNKFGSLKSMIAFPIVLALPEKDRGNDDLVMKTRLSDSNFKGELKKRLDEFLKKIK